jgi:hypothetical protein
MDGRVQLPVNEWMRRRFGVDYVDTITEPGPNRILATGTDAGAVEAIRRRLGISVGRHGSRVVAVVGHADCAGNPADSEAQAEHTRRAVDVVRSWGLAVEVVGLWVDHDWQVHPLR